MGRITVTIEWVILYFFALCLLSALIDAAQGKDAPRPAWLDTAVFLASSIGLGLIVWQGVLGHLPGTGGSAHGVFPFIARFIAWSGCIGMLGGGTATLAGYLLVRGPMTQQPEGMGLIIIIPGTVGCLTGIAAGAAIAIAKTFW